MLPGDGIAMQLSLRKPIIHLALVAAFAADPAIAADLTELPALNAAIAESSISGLSSGAFMAIQFGTAWSSVIKGVGVVAGGPFFCAQANLAIATSACMNGPPPPLSIFTDLADRKARSGAIDATDNLKRQQVYLFHGFNDSTVARSVTDAAAEFYAHYQAEKGHLFYQSALGAGHAFIVAGAPHSAVGDCSASRSPFIDRCDHYDQAGVILRHFYGALNPPRDAGPEGTIKSFDQASYTKPDTPGTLSLGQTGFVFVPKDCETASGPPCRVHIVLHGCEQNDESVGRQVVDRMSFNAWADTNRIVVLYPQTSARPLLLPLEPFNPLACWDWWGYSSGDDSYVTKFGKQIKVIKSMLDALTAGFRPDTGTPPPENVPDAPLVNDISDASASLVWRPIKGASAYRVSRAGADGNFALVGTIAALSFADAELEPKSSYRWRVTAIVNGIEGPPSPETNATTLARPPHCDDPGNCPVTVPAN